VNDGEQRGVGAPADMPAEALAVPMQQRGRTSNEWRAFRSARWIRSVDEIEDLDKVARRTFGLKDDNPKSASRLKSSTCSCGIDMDES
jgi:hypothetical protein